MLRQAADVGLECWVLGADGFSAIADQVKDDPSLLDTRRLLRRLSPTRTTAEIVQVLRQPNFTDKYGQKRPPGFNALGYDAAKIHSDRH